jgi:hypothetical protein
VTRSSHFKRRQNRYDGANLPHPPSLPTTMSRNTDTQRRDNDFVMNEAERGVGTGTRSSQFSSPSFLHPISTSNTTGHAPTTTGWGRGDPHWGENPDVLGEAQEQTHTTRNPLPSQSATYSSTSQYHRTTSVPSRYHTSEDDRDLRRPTRRQRSPESTELVNRVRSLGIDIPYRYDSDIPWDARSILEDLLYHLDQKTNEVTHLQRKLDSANRESRVRKREDSLEDRRPSKRRERSRGDDSSYGPSPIVASRSFGAPPPRTNRDRDDYSTDAGRIALPPQTLARATGPSTSSQGHPDAGPTRPPAPPRQAQRPDPVMINGRAYEPVLRITPPGPLKPMPNLLQQEVRRRVPPPPPAYSENEDPYNFDESDEDSGDDVVSPPRDDRSLAPEIAVPRLWGVVRVSDFNGNAGQEGLERDNAMRNMLSRNAYHSRATNIVYVGDSAREARNYERSGEAYTPHTTDNNNQVYVRARRGLPLNPQEVKQLRTLYRDNKGRFSERQRVEAYLLLKELYTVACRVLPEHRDRAMSFLLEPRGFDPIPPAFFPTRALTWLRGLPRSNPPRQGISPAASDLAAIDDVGLYLLNYHRPGSTNASSGVAFDYAFRVGRRSVFGHALARLLGPNDREILHAFRRQFVLVMAMPRRYREAIVEHDRARPQSPFVPQGGPTYTIYRPRLEPSQAPNLSMQDVLNVLLDNCIPPEWVDHAYAYGVLALNHLYSGAPLTRGLLDPADNERLVRLHIYGEPPAIAAWDGWRHPSHDEVQTLHDIMDQEDHRAQQRVSRDAPIRARGFEAPGWLLVGQSGVVEYLTHRPQGTASQYTVDHPVALPYFAELDTAVGVNAPVNPDATMAPPSGNPLAGLATTDVDMAANADTDPLSGLHQGLDSALAPLTLGHDAPPEVTEDRLGA